MSAACWLEPHWASTVVAATSSGSPAASHAVRATLKACMPIWLTQPPTTWPTSAGSTPVRSNSGLQRHAEQVGGVHGGQASVAAPHGGANGIDDHDVAHGRSLCPGSW